MRIKSGIIFSFLISSTAFAEINEVKYNTPGAGNPIIPGYFADPTVKKFGDTYYMYATTDGNGGGRGPSQVWVSKDFVNWTFMPMNWPNTPYYWAPDVMERDGKYYLYYCEPCQIYCGESDTPRGPWQNILGDNEEVLIKDRHVTGAITLDGQTFVDDDNEVYFYFGTWGIYPGFGCGAGRFTKDLKSLTDLVLIPNTDMKDFFEAPFVFKRNGIYYFTYSSGSCHDHTYRVQYGMSKEGPLGPFTYAENNPILETSLDQTVHGPGHHSIIVDGDDYYMVYHRHNLPNSTWGMHRQIAVDKIVFAKDGTIEKIVPSHNGVGFLAPSTNKFENIALGAKVKASSYYDENFRPENAVDDNNATLWRPSGTGEEWLEIDLGKTRRISRIRTAFEYPTSFVQYNITASNDGKEWHVISDKSSNLLNGSPMMEFTDAEARFIRLNFLGAEKNGMSAALWNIKVYSDAKTDPPQRWVYLPAVSVDESKGELSNDMGMLAGKFYVEGGDLSMKTAEADRAYVIPSNASLKSSFVIPETIKKGEYTLSMRIYGTASEINDFLKTNGVALPALKKADIIRNTLCWHNIALVSNGKNMTYYLNGEEVAKVKAGDSFMKTGNLSFSASSQPVTVTDIRLYNYRQETAEINHDFTVRTRHLAQRATPQSGLLSKISASDYLPGMSLSRLENKGLNGSFNSHGSKLPVVLKDKRVAFEFDGTQWLHSDFGLPASVEGSSPYAVAAWMINPSLNDIECLLDINDARGELEKVVFGFGKDSKAGIAAHYNSYHDMGISDPQPFNEWKHVVATFDGYKQYIYIDGKKVSEKDITLRLPLSRKMFIGKNNNGENPFSGWVSDISLYDRSLSEKEVSDLYNKDEQTAVLFDFDPSLWTFSERKSPNEGCIGGVLSLSDNSRIEESYYRRAALNGLLSVKDASSDNIKKNIETVIIQFIPGKKSYNLIDFGNATLSLGKNGNSITIKSGEEKQTFDIKKSVKPASWNYVAITGQSLIVNGEKFETGKDISLHLSGEEIKIGSEGIAGIGRVIVSGKAEKDSDIDLLARVEVKDAPEHTPSLTAKAVSPDFVRLIADEIKDVKYQFVNITTGTSCGWQTEPYYLDDNISENQNYEYIVYIKDASGNISGSNKESVRFSEKSFPLITGSFEDASKDYKYFDKAVWSGVTGLEAKEIRVKNEDGKLKLGSSCRNFTYEAADNGPFIYREINGDFVAQVEIDDFSGYRERNAVGFNEGGLMIMTGEPAKEDYSLMHLGVFPYWSVGNMLTHLTRYGRPQYVNKKGWELDRYLQVERCGNIFFFRTSSDGKKWEDMPSSPIHRDDLKDKPVKVGLYQVTYTENDAEVSFDNFCIYLNE